MGLAQRRLDRRLAGVEPAAREADLALVVAHVPRAAGEQHLGALLAVGEGDEHGRRPGVGERRRVRLAGRCAGEDRGRCRRRVIASGCAAGARQPARRPTPPAAGSAARRRRRSASRRLGHQLDGAQPSSASWRRTSGRPAVLRLASTLPGRLLADLELLPGRDQLLEVGGRSVEGHGRHATGGRSSFRIGPDRGRLRADRGRSRAMPPTARPAVRPMASLRSTGWPGWRFAALLERRVPPHEAEDHGGDGEQHPAGVVDVQPRQHGQHHEHADDDEVDDPVGPPGEQPERAERPVDEGRVEDDSPPASVGTTGSRLCSPIATSTSPMRYSAAWCNQNGRSTGRPSALSHRTPSAHSVHSEAGRQARASRRLGGLPMHVLVPTTRSGRSPASGHGRSRVIYIMPGMPPMPPPPPPPAWRTAARACRPRGTRW